MDPWLHRPLMVDPPMCELKHLEDGTYSIEDILIFHEILDLKLELNKSR